MGYPRYLTVPPDTPGIHHCVSRCVRRAFLCGNDPVSGRCFEHRKHWLEERILFLGELFAVAVHAYAVMSNHLHLVIELDPDQTDAWSEREVARRWLSRLANDDPVTDARVEALAAQSERIAVLRQRLGSLSWYMRELKEPLARKANREDGVTGHFWEGRFGTQDACDDAAVLAAMVYVDLNPVRAGVAETPKQSLHTSIRRRLNVMSELDSPLPAVAAGIEPTRLPLTLRQYLELVDWTGRQLHPGKSGAIAEKAPPILERVKMSPSQWLLQVPVTEIGFSRAIGSLDSLIARARARGKRWLHGVGAAKLIAGSARTI